MPSVRPWAEPRKGNSDQLDRKAQKRHRPTQLPPLQVLQMMGLRAVAVRMRTIPGPFRGTSGSLPGPDAPAGTRGCRAGDCAICPTPRYSCVIEDPSFLRIFSSLTAEQPGMRVINNE